MSINPLSGADAGEEDYNEDYEAGNKLLRRIRKENHFNIPARQRTAGTRPAARIGGSYDIRDVGGVGFEIGEEFDQPYDAVRVNASGDVKIITAAGEQSTIASDTDGVVEEVSVAKVVADGTTVSPGDIVLYRH